MQGLTLHLEKARMRVDLSFFSNAVNNVGIVRTATETTFLDGTPPQPASKFNRPHMLEFAASKGFVPGDSYQVGKDAWKVVYLPAKAMQTKRLVKLARKTLGLSDGLTDLEVIDLLLVGYNDADGEWHWGISPFVPIYRTTTDDQVKAQWLAQAIFSFMGATLMWCSPKSGATAIWLYQGDGTPRVWNDIDPFFINEVTQKLPKRLSALNRDTILSHYSEKVCVIEVELVHRADGEPTHFVTTEAGDKIRPNPGDLVMVVWKAEVGDDGYGIISKHLKNSMIHDVELPLRAENHELVDHMLGHSLWQTRFFTGTQHGINPMGKCDMGVTATEHIVVRRLDGSRFNADIAMNSDGLKAEVGLHGDGLFMILDHVTDRPGVTARTNRHMMTVAYEPFLKNRIFYGQAAKNDDIIAGVSNGNFPLWMSIMAENYDHEGNADPVLADNHTGSTVNTYHKRVTDVVEHIGDITYTRKGLEDVRSQHNDRQKPEVRRNRIMRDTYHYPVPASDNYRSLKPLRLALLTGHLPHDFELANGEWINTKVGFVVNTATAVYMMVILEGDFDDHGTGLHGISSCDDAFYATQAAKDAGVPDMIVEANDLISVIFRWPTGVSCNGNGEWGVGYFVLKPHITERIGLATRFDLDDEMYRFDMELRPKRLDEVVYPAKNDPATFQPQGQKFYRNGAVATTYGIDTFVWQLQSALEVAEFGGIGAISNVDMFAFQHKLNLPWFCHNEVKVDLCTQSIPSAYDITRIVDYIATGVDKIGAMDGYDVDAVALERFLDQLGEHHPLFKSANPGLLFGFLEVQFENFTREFNKRYDALLREQTDNMLRLLADIELDGYKKPRLFQVYEACKDYIQKKAMREEGTRKLTTEQWDTIANMVIIRMEQANIPQDVREQDMLDTLAFLYRKGAYHKWDQPMMNGELLVLLGQTLAKLRAKNNDAHLCEEIQTTIRCKAVDHDHLEEHAEGCWIQRNEGPVMTKAWREEGDQMSIRCAVKVHNLRQAGN